MGLDDRWRNLDESAGRSGREWKREARLPTKSLISIVDDDDDARAALTGLVESLGFTVEAFASAVEFLGSRHIRHTACLIADVQMPRMTGTELHSHLVEAGHVIPTILVTAYPDDNVRAWARARGVIGYLSKPLDENALLGCVHSALAHAKPDSDPS
jgi:FixJ family two-component response regulator